VTLENDAMTQIWVTKTVWQRIPGRRARNSETPTTITVHSIPRKCGMIIFRWLADRRRELELLITVRLTIWYF